MRRRKRNGRSMVPSRAYWKISSNKHGRAPCPVSPPAARRPNRARPRERRRRDGDAEERRHDRRPEDERNRRRPREDERRAQSRPRTQQTCATAGEKPQHEQNGAARERLAQRALIAGRAEQHQRTQDHREHRRNDREAGQPPLRCPASRRCYPLRRRERRQRGQRGPRADLRVLHPPRDVGGKPAQAPREQRECQPPGLVWLRAPAPTDRTRPRLGDRREAPRRARGCRARHPAAREIRRPGCRCHGHEGCRPSRREPFAGGALRLPHQRRLTDRGDVVEPAAGSLLDRGDRGVLPAAFEKTRFLHTVEGLVERPVRGQQLCVRVALHLARDEVAVELVRSAATEVDCGAEDLYLEGKERARLSAHPLLYRKIDSALSTPSVAAAPGRAIPWPLRRGWKRTPFVSRGERKMLRFQRSSATPPGGRDALAGEGCRGAVHRLDFRRRRGAAPTRAW